MLVATKWRRSCGRTLPKNLAAPRTCIRGETQKQLKPLGRCRQERLYLSDRWRHDLVRRQRRWLDVACRVGGRPAERDRPLTVGSTDQLVNTTHPVCTPTLACQLAIQVVQHVRRDVSNVPRKERCRQIVVRTTQFLQRGHGVPALVDLIREQSVDGDLFLVGRCAHLQVDERLIGLGFATGAPSLTVALHPARRTTALYLPEGSFWIDTARIVSRTVNGDQLFTMADLVGDRGLDPLTSTV